MTTQNRVPCRTPTPGREGVTNVPEWKFDLLRNAILTALKPGPVPFGDLNDRVRALLGEDELKQLGSLGWHVTTVKLELECRGELSRFKEKGRQMLMLVQ